MGYGSFYLYAMSWYDKLLPSILRFDTRSSVKSMSMLGMSAKWMWIMGEYMVYVQIILIA